MSRIIDDFPKDISVDGLKNFVLDYQILVKRFLGICQQDHHVFRQFLSDASGGEFIIINETSI